MATRRGDSAPRTTARYHISALSTLSFSCFSHILEFSQAPAACGEEEHSAYALLLVYWFAAHTALLSASMLHCFTEEEHSAYCFTALLLYCFTDEEREHSHTALLLAHALLLVRCREGGRGSGGCLSLQPVSLRPELPQSSAALQQAILRTSELNACQRTD